MPDARPAAVPVLRTHRLTRNFGGLVAVHEVSIALNRGELHAVIGPNGAGKTTLVNLLCGELRPTAGHIALDGREVTGEPAWRMARLGIARSFQRINIFASLPVLENVRLAAQAVDQSRRNPLKPADGAIDLVDKAHAALAGVGLAADDARIAGGAGVHQHRPG